MLFPPMLRIKIAIAGAGDAHLYALWKNMQENIARPPRVKIRCHHNHAVPFSFFHQPRKRLRHFQRAIRVVYKPHDPVPWHSSLDQVMLHELGSNARKFSAACSGSSELKYTSLMLYDLLVFSTMGRISMCQ